MQAIRRFFYGRYGSDHLSIALLVCFLVLAVLGRLLRIEVLHLLGYVPLVWCYFRMLSRNLEKRRSENRRFLAVWDRIRRWFLRQQAHVRSLKTHRYYRCPQCAKKLRVPRGKGRICIRCPVCHTEFIKKT